jgi:AcrR family transcriptional regulator
MRDVDSRAPARRIRLSAEQRRESIVRAAVEVFTAAGYRAGKVSDVAALVGVSEPVVFQNFGSKAALFAAVLERVADEARAELEALVARHGSALELLAHVLSPAHAVRHDPAAHASSARPPWSHAALFADAVALTAEPDLPAAARDLAAVIAGHLADLVRRGQADGDIRADADPDAVAWLLLSVLSARPFRAAAMPGRLEDAVTGLALRPLAPPGR